MASSFVYIYYEIAFSATFSTFASIKLYQISNSSIIYGRHSSSEIQMSIYRIMFVYFCIRRESVWWLKYNIICFHSIQQALLLLWQYKYTLAFSAIDNECTISVLNGPRKSWQNVLIFKSTMNRLLCQK